MMSPVKDFSFSSTSSLVMCSAGGGTNKARMRRSARIKSQDGLFTEAFLQNDAAGGVQSVRRFPELADSDVLLRRKRSTREALKPLVWIKHRHPNMSSFQMTAAMHPSTNGNFPLFVFQIMQSSRLGVAGAKLTFEPVSMELSIFVPSPTPTTETHKHGPITSRTEGRGGAGGRAPCSGFFAIFSRSTGVDLRPSTPKERSDPVSRKRKQTGAAEPADALDGKNQLLPNSLGI